VLWPIGRRDVISLGRELQPQSLGDHLLKVILSHSDFYRWSTERQAESLTIHGSGRYASCMPFRLPLVYPILDASAIPSVGRGEYLRRLAESLRDAGVTLLEYRNKTGADGELRADCAVLREAMAANQVKLILDDRADLIDQVEFDGVHVDAGDIPPADARALLGADRIVGTFGGSQALLPGILAEPVDYLAIGPVYPTTTKDTDKRPIGVEGVRRLRAQAGKDALLVAAAGITLATAPAILEAGANCVAVSAAIFGAANPAAEFLRWMKELS
jgi:thiamine-phosphate pyrophosphorylase